MAFGVRRPPHLYPSDFNLYPSFFVVVIIVPAGSACEVPDGGTGERSSHGPPDGTERTARTRCSRKAAAEPSQAPGSASICGSVSSPPSRPFASFAFRPTRRSRRLLPLPPALSPFWLSTLGFRLWTFDFLAAHVSQVHDPASHPRAHARGYVAGSRGKHPTTHPRPTPYAQRFHAPTHPRPHGPRSTVHGLRLTPPLPTANTAYS